MAAAKPKRKTGKKRPVARNAPRIEQRLRESEERFHDTFELAAVGICHVDPSGKFLLVNRSLCEMLGYTEAELLALTVKQISHPEDRNVTDETRERMYAGRIPSVQAEKRYLRKDGTVVWVDVRLAVKRAPSGEPLYVITVIEDISARKRTEEALRESEARFRSLIELSSDWYWEQDAEFRFVRRQGQQAGLGGARGFAIGRHVWDAGFEVEGGWEAHRIMLEAYRPFRGVVMQGRLADGKPYYVSVSGEPFFDKDGRFRGYRGIAKEITDEKLVEERIRHQAMHDGLTALPNRVMFDQMLEVAIESARRYKRRFAVLFIDLDGFKAVNDTFGHQSGDVLLRETAQRLKETLRASDIVGRVGGDEFVALVQEVEAPAQVAAVANKVLAALARRVVGPEGECAVSASIGVSLFPADAEDGRTLMKNADAAMYRAKARGKNKFEFSIPAGRPEREP